MASISGKMSENGRITVPLRVRASMGLARGGSVVLEVSDGELRVRSTAEAMGAAREASRRLLAGKAGTSVADFLGERRREAERET